MLYERRQLSMDRVAAFVKRVLIIAMQLQPNASIALLVVVRDLLRVRDIWWKTGLALWLTFPYSEIS